MEMMALRQSGENCVVCEKSGSNGIWLWNKFLCETCERKIVSTDTDDEHYNFYLSRLKKVSLPKVN
jgi:hypothetical protein